jgi:hypothetical protein
MGHYGQHWMHEMAHQMELLSIIILVIFLAENLLLIIANGLRFFTNCWHTLDIVVVVISLVFELQAVFGEGEEAAVGLMVVARSWRFIRLGHGITEINSHEDHDPHHHHEEKTGSNIEFHNEGVGA